ncbi:hypothetical protein [Photorhabdus sp. RM71S]|uniref:hypothetical protein n=1 Tax=Photorhabdus sp. RM71S TaxID=3342824 RepID=UPI0036D99E3B
MAELSYRYMLGLSEKAGMIYYAMIPLLPVLRKKRQLISLMTPGFVAAELVIWFNQNKIARPSYTTLQNPVSKALSLTECH